MITEAIKKAIDSGFVECSVNCWLFNGTVNKLQALGYKVTKEGYTYIDARPYPTELRQ